MFKLLPSPKSVITHFNLKITNVCSATHKCCNKLKSGKILGNNVAAMVTTDVTILNQKPISESKKENYTESEYIQ